MAPLPVSQPFLRKILRGLGWAFIVCAVLVALQLAKYNAVKVQHFFSNRLGWTRYDLFIILGVGFVALIIECVVTIPGRLVKHEADPIGGRLTQSEYLKAKNDVRATLLQALAGGLLLLGAFFTWRQLQETGAQVRIAQKQLTLAQEQADHTRSDKIAERFSNAVDQLGSNAVDTRLGGIYALERIADSSEEDDWRITEVIAAFVQRHTGRENLRGPSQDPHLPWMRKRAPDVQVALRILGRRPDPQGVWLGPVDLRRSVMLQANLDKAWLAGAHLEEADLRYASLVGVDFRHAYLNEASLCGADLRDADLKGANLEGAIADRTTKWPKGFDWHAAGVIMQRAVGGNCD